MGKRDGRSRDQKRKAKLKQRALRSQRQNSLAYGGGKYKSQKYVMPLFRAEVGIYEAYVISDKELTDDEVSESIESLIEDLDTRTGSASIDSDQLPLDEEEDDDDDEEGEGEGDTDFVTWSIERNWSLLAEKQPLPSVEDRIGILRTILNSLNVWHVKGGSRGYLHYLEGFMKQAGVKVEKVDGSGNILGEPTEDPLLGLGRRWMTRDDPEAAIAFEDVARKLLRTGEAARVVEVCQQLLGEVGGPSPRQRELQSWAMRGHQALALGGREPGQLT